MTKFVKQVPFLILGLSVLVLAGCKSDRTIGATADRQYTGAANVNRCPEAKEGGRGVLTLAKGETKKTVNLCFEAEEAEYDGKPTKIIWGDTSPLGPATAELSNEGDKLTMVIVRGRTGTQITLQQQGNKRIPANFSVNALDLVASSSTGEISTSTDFKGSVTIPPLRGLNYLDSKGRGADVGYDESPAFRADVEFARDITKESQAREVEDGKIQLQVESVNPETGEISGKFLSMQPTGIAQFHDELEIRGRFIGTFK